MWSLTCVHIQRSLIIINKLTPSSLTPPPPSVHIKLTHLLHGAHNNNSCLDGLRRRSHGYGCRGDGHRDRLALLVGELTGLGDGLHGGGGGEGQRRGGGRLGGQGEVEQGQGDRLLLHAAPLPSVLLLPGGAVLHLDARVHGLVAPQVVAVLELLVAGGADVGRPARLGERFD